MNTLKFYPKVFREKYAKIIDKSGEKHSPERYHNRIVIATLVFSILSIILFYYLKINLVFSFLVFILLNIFFYFRVSLKATARIKKMEKVFPDVISLMSSNLRAGITIDRSFLLSARPEFSPLDQEILKAGKEVSTGKDIVMAFNEMSKRIGSEKISKVIILINSGLRSGGNISDLLEQTSANMKEKEFIEKRAASSILMYVIFIFFAVGVGAPVLFSLSTIIVDVVINISSKVPVAENASYSLPFAFSQVAISPGFIISFALIFIIVTDFISCIVIGLVNKGDGKSGLKYFIPLVLFSLIIFFTIRILISGFLSESYIFS